MLFRFLLLTLLTQFTLVLTATAQTAIFNATTSALPNQAVSLQGNFGLNAKVFMLAGLSTEPVPLAILVQSANQLSVQIPHHANHDLYQLWVEDQGQRSNTVFVNQAQAMHSDSPLISPGGPLRIFGRNLKLTIGTPQVRLVAQNGGSTLDVAIDLNQSDAYQLRLTMPANLQPGMTYDLLVYNGQGGPPGQTRMPQSLTAVTAGQDYFQLGVGWAPKLDFYRNVYNVKTDSRLNLKVIGDGVANDHDAIQAAIDRASADGGGVVYLPAGTYMLRHNYFDYLFMRDRVVVQGAGKDQTILKFGYQLDVSHMGVQFYPGTNLSGLADMSLINIDNNGSRSMGNMRANYVSEVFFQRIRFDLNRGDQMELDNCDKLVIANSDFTQGVTDNNQYRGPINMNGCTNFVIARNSFTFAVNGLNLNNTHEGVFENNRVYRNGAARYPAWLTNHVLVLNFAQNVAVLNNLIKVINGPAQNSNDGEAIIAEGGGADRVDEETGTVSAATATSLQDNSKNWGDFRQQPVVAIVSGRGMGQWRSIISRNGNTLNLDRSWEVVPGAGSHYAIFNWGARNWLLQNNIMEGNRRGITLYQNATTQVAIVNNILTNSGSIDLTPFQQQQYGRYQQFIPMYNNQIVGNSVANTDRSNGVFIGVHTVQHVQEKTFGTSVIGLEMRNNSLTAGRPNVPAVVDDSFPEGYLNYLEYHPGRPYDDEQIPVVLGTIFENNTAINCDNGLYLNSGSYNTLVCNLQLINSLNGLKDDNLDKVGHGSIRTSSCGQVAASSSIVSNATYTITAKHSSKVLDVYDNSWNDGGKIVQWGLNGGGNQQWTMTDLNNGYYAIKAVFNGKALEVKAASMDDGAQVYQWSIHLSDDQQFKLIDAGGGYFNIMAKHSQKYLTIEGNSPDDGAYLRQWSNNGSDNQKFRFTMLRAPNGRMSDLRQEGEPSNVRVYPNPAVDLIKIEGAAGSVVSIVDMLGRVRFTGVSSVMSYQVDISALASGLYLLQVKKVDGVISRKLVISH